MTDWDRLFCDYISSFKTVDEINPTNNKFTVALDLPPSDNIQFRIPFKNPSRLIVLLNNSIFINKIKNISKKNYYVPQSKLTQNVPHKNPPVESVDNFRISNFDATKVKYFIEHDTNIYLKVDSINFTNMTLRGLISRNIVKKLLLKVEIIDKIKIIIFRVDSIVFKKDKELVKLPFIKSIIDLRNNREKKSESAKKEIIIYNKFNKYKFGKNKLEESNNKIMALLS